MKVDIDRAQLENRDSNLSEALENRQNGDSEIKVSILCCKFKPNCDDAIPFYCRAADIYSGAGMYADEIYCREKLVFCFRTTKSPWEEGREYEKIGKIQLTQLNNLEDAFTNMTNAYNAFFSKPEYDNAINCLVAFSNLYYEKEEYDYAERCMKIAYDGILNIFHVIVDKKDEPSEFLYKALDIYLNVLFKNDKVKIAIDACTTAVKAFEQHEEDKTKIIHIIGFQLLGFVIFEDQENFNKILEQARTLCTKNSDVRFLNNIEYINEDIQTVNEKGFKDHMIEITYEYPSEVERKLRNLFNIRSKVKVSEHENMVVTIDQPEDWT